MQQSAEDLPGAGRRRRHAGHRRQGADRTRAGRRARACTTPASASPSPAAGRRAAWPCCSIRSHLETPIAGFNGGLFVQARPLDPRAEDPAGRCRGRGRRADPRARPRCLGLSRQRLADHEARRAARRARGLDRQVRAEGRDGFRRPCWTTWRRSSASATTSTRCRAAKPTRRRPSASGRPPTARSPTTSTSRTRTRTRARWSTICRAPRLPAEEIATIGDQPNDVLMFKRSGFSIAMGNASDQVKAQASATTDSYNDEGFAKAMERFVLGVGGLRRGMTR